VLIQAFVALPRTLKMGVALATAVFILALGWVVVDGLRAQRQGGEASAVLSTSRQYELAGSLANLHQTMVVYAQQAALHPQTMGPDWVARMEEHIQQLRADLSGLRDVQAGFEAATMLHEPDRKILEIAAGLERHLAEIEAHVRAPLPPQEARRSSDTLELRALKALAIAELALQESPAMQDMLELARDQDRLQREVLVQEGQNRYRRSMLAIVGVVLMGYVAIIALILASANISIAAQAKENAMKERLTAGEQRAQAVQAKVQFLRMVSHELRTPLQTLQGASESLELRLKGTAVEPTLRRMRAAVRQLQTQIGDLSHFARTSEVDVRVASQPTDILELLASIAASYEEAARAKGLRLTTDFGSLPGTVQIDTARLWQILSNLLENAIKYTDKGEVRLGAGYAKGKLIVSVQDTGRGISPEAQAQVWEPFYRVVGSSEDVPGTGLGLAIVKRLVNSLSGEIQLSSRPGKGSSFILRVPAPEVGPPRQPPQAPMAGFAWDDVPLTAPGELTRPNARAVLIVGGDEQHRQAVTRLLESLGEAWVAEERPDQALRHARQTRFDLVLVDLASTRQAGLDCAKALRREDLLAPNGRIVGVSDLQPLPEKPAPGFDAMVGKPIRLATLRQLLDG
jgi:signal transduction histidine kinase/CheY-like chemotaxis protein